LTLSRTIEVASLTLPGSPPDLEATVRSLPAIIARGHSTQLDDYGNVTSSVVSPDGISYNSTTDYRSTTTSTYKPADLATWHVKQGDTETATSDVPGRACTDSSCVRHVRYGYDALGRRTQVTREDGDAGALYLQTTMTLDGHGIAHVIQSCDHQSVCRTT